VAAGQFSMTRPYNKRDPLALAWRSPERVQARHEYIIELASMDGGRPNTVGRPSKYRLTLKQIALLVSEKFGTENGRKPLDHSSILHQLRKHEEGKCPCRVTKGIKEAPRA